MCGRLEEGTKDAIVTFILREWIIKGNVIGLLRRECEKIENVNSSSYLWIVESFFIFLFFCILLFYNFSFQSFHIKVLLPL